MITYQGWATVREAFDEAGESELLLQQIHEHLKKRILHLEENSSNLFLHLQFYNGELKLVVAGAANHKDSFWLDVLTLFVWLAENAIGSYGLLHLHDDEDKNGLHNQFQKFVLKKGKLTNEIDLALSPIIPELENI